jgi:hypothetical protein
MWRRRSLRKRRPLLARKHPSPVLLFTVCIVIIVVAVIRVFACSAGGGRGNCRG